MVRERAMLFACDVNKQVLKLCGRMEVAGSTPTKSFSSLTPKSKNTVCLQYGVEVDNADKRRKLFDGGEKTQACKNLDRIFALGDLQSEISYFSNIVCRGCSDKNITLLKKVDLARTSLGDTQERLEKERGEIVTKRWRSEAWTDSSIGERSGATAGIRSKQRTSLFPEASNSSIPSISECHRVKDQWTQAEEESNPTPSSVSVSL